MYRIALLRDNRLPFEALRMSAVKTMRQLEAMRRDDFLEMKTPAPGGGGRAASGLYAFFISARILSIS